MKRNLLIFLAGVILSGTSIAQDAVVEFIDRGDVERLKDEINKANERSNPTQPS